MNRTTETEHYPGLPLAEIQRAFSLGHYACLIDGMDFTNAMERWRAQPAIKSKIKTLGAYTLSLGGFKPKEIYARRYLSESSEFIGAGYESVVLSRPGEGVVRKYFNAPFRYTGGTSADEHAGVLDEDLALLGKYVPSATVPAKNGLSNLPFVGLSEHLTSYSEQQRITRVVGCLRTLFRNNGWKQRRELKIARDIKEIVDGSLAMYGQEKALPDVIGADNTLVYDNGNRLRVAQVDASLFRKSRFRYDELIDSQQAQALRALNEFSSYI